MAEFLKQAGLDYGYFAPDKPIHKAIANLDYGSELILRVRSDGQFGWEIADPNGVTVTRMALAFKPSSQCELQRFW